MSLDQFTNMYIDYINNFLTIGAFADHYCISDKTAERIIDLGRQVSQLELLK